MDGEIRKRTSRAGVVVVPRPETLAKATWLPALAKGPRRHDAPLLRQRRPAEQDIATVQYPEEKVKYPERFRGLHRLMLREDGCGALRGLHVLPTVCPAHCITIVAEETGNGNEKRPAIFEIDELRCVVCGLCVEACPCDAIRMDTGVHASPTEKRFEAVLGKSDLMSRGTRSIAVQGGTNEWRDTEKTP